MAQQEEKKQRITGFNDDKNRRREKIRRDQENKGDKFEKGSRRKR
jgi:hypothetical protein